MKRGIALALAAVVVAASAAMGGTVPAKADVDPYITDGTHHVNGRDWRTGCEPYSQTTRCRTEIWATQVTEENGRFLAKTDWYFNNLTYLPSPRALWKTNPLGFTGNFTGADGRKWRTSCDSAESGRNGCRTYAEARVIESHQVNGVWHYKWVTKSIFNNIVQFTAAPAVKPSTPSATPTTVTMPDAKLRECINVALRKPITSAITLKAAVGITELDCSESKVSNLAGLEKFSNLEALYLDSNQVSGLAPLKGLKKLQVLSVASNAISDLSPLSGVTSLTSLAVDDNTVSGVAPLKSLTSLEDLSLSSNKIKDLAPLAGLKKLRWLQVADNQLTSLTSLAGSKGLVSLDVSYNKVSDLTPLASIPALEELSFSGNGITSLAPLRAMTKLVLLDASDNKITDVSPLSGLTRLDMLALDRNGVRDVAPLQGLTRLSMLSLWGNDVVDVAPLAKLTKLEYLLLADNNISRVAPLAALTKLEILGLWGNPIADKDSLAPLIARGCEVLFDEPMWDEDLNGPGPLTGARLAEQLGATVTS